MRNPLLVIRDPELIKQVTVKDFDHFVNHRSFVRPEEEPLLGNSLFALQDQKWKDMRATLSPAFTGNKMRLMFQLVEETCKTAMDHLNQEAQKGPLVLDMKEFFSRYTNDVIASTAFGLQINSLKERDNEFYLMGRKATNLSGLATIRIFLLGNFQKLTKILKIRIFNMKFTKYFNKLVLNTIKYRIEHDIVRPDMINLLMEARLGKLKSNENTIADEKEGFATGEESSNGQRTHNREWSDDDIVAQCFVFLLGGFETASTLMCFCAEELMENSEIQNRLLEEIDDVNCELNGKPLTYEILQNMKYLDMVICETLRKWPPVVAMDRVCAKPYVLTDDNTGESIEINIGEYIWIPIAGIHYDSNYYPEPNEFDPERFNDNNKHTINPFTYMPFGVGPRNCIGSRFALMESKVILFHMLSKYKFGMSPKTVLPMDLSTSRFQLHPKNGIWIQLNSRN